ncbi:hypothetical protein HS088_TW07G01355 [Tripterygium wilfordii]|uniref:Protein BIG GRAIN 1-like E n=1 Tax=Tripterygium wilfordii TaxID=458696 RepID=A0A7J7DHD9_TRIWF|nr:protein BIG GRAIN 1-like E [Tripterygium wilfordii]KAF5745762.1 hypothetical protein HS088_TW07G01355 [Tripterygium wilfordii]
MSTKGIQDQPSKLYNKKSSFHGRNGSDELDVFEAARYFSGYNEAHQQVYNVTTTNYTQRSMRGGRISLDVPMMARKSLPQDPNYKIDVHQKQQQDKKYKQPSSPGGRLASFLNSLFNQTGSKKKKKSSKSATQSMKDEDDQSPNSMRRRRRSSISHFRSSNATSADTKSLYSSSSSGFRTPPANYAQTPIKSLRSFFDHKQLVVPSQVCVRPTIGKLINHDHHQLHRRSQDLYENKVKFSNGSTEQKEQLRKLDDVGDDGAESDSSSDLFELENFDLGFYSSGLPVYETTHIDTIKRSAPPITTGAVRA